LHRPLWERLLQGREPPRLLLQSAHSANSVVSVALSFRLLKSLLQIEEPFSTRPWPEAVPGWLRPDRWRESMRAPAWCYRRLHRPRLAQWWSSAVHLVAWVRSRMGSAASFCNLTERVTLSEPQWLGNASIEYTARQAVAGLEEPLAVIAHCTLAGCLPGEFTIH
jgi:hypothetical protein